MSLTTLVTLVLAAAVAPPSTPPTTPLPEPVVTRQTSFSIPYELHNVTDPSQEPAAVQLYMSIDRGATWRLYSKVPPRQGSFLFRATADGEYWFAVRMVDRAGQLRPPWNNVPELRVNVDTVSPTMDITATRGPNGQITARWEIREPHLKPDSLTIQYRGDSSQPWQLVSLGTQNSRRTEAGCAGEITWVPQGASKTVQMRGEVSDLAGNMGTAHIQLGTAQSVATSGAPIATQPQASASQPGPTTVMASPAATNSPAVATPPVVIPPAWPANPPTSAKPPAIPAQPVAVSRPAATTPPVVAAQATPPVLATPPVIAILPPAKAAVPVSQPAPPSVVPPVASQPVTNQAADGPSAGKAPPATVAPGGAAPVATNGHPPATDPAWHAPPLTAQPSAQSGPPVAFGVPSSRRAGGAAAAPRGAVFDPRFPVNPIRPANQPAAVAGAVAAGLSGSAMPPVGPGTSVAMQFNPPLHNQYPPSTGATGAPGIGWATDGPQLQTVRSRTFALDYDPAPLAPAAVNRVEIWGTRNGGKTWNCVGTVEPHRTSTVVKVEDDGLYGFQIVPRSAAGQNDSLPRSGDAPQVWVGVDTAPVNPAGAPASAVRIRDVRPVSSNGM